MTVAEATKALSDLRDDPGMDLSVPEFQAIGIAICILGSLEPSQRALIDRLIATPGIGTN